MTASNIVTLLTPENRDATLIAQCAAFDRIEQEMLEHDVAHDRSMYADLRACSLYGSIARIDDLHDQCDELVVMLCQYRARTLAGIAARVRTLLHLSPDLFEVSDADCWDARMVGALLRDLRKVLNVANL